jgi:DNA uptake protein ComE-like DNA-binding protein
MENKRNECGRARPVFAGVVLVGFGLMLSACTNPPANDQQLQDQAAKATEAAKKQSQEALAQARVAAGNAEKAVNDVAAGVKKGLDTKTPASAPVDINSASQAELASLPGISVGKAAQIIHHRPYGSVHDLVKAGVLSESQYEALGPKATAD